MPNGTYHAIGRAPLPHVLRTSPSRSFILAVTSTLHPHFQHASWCMITISARRPFSSPFFVIFYSPRHLQAMSFSSSVTLASMSAFASTFSFVSTSTVAAAASSTTADNLFSSRPSYFSSTLTSLIACLTLMLGFMYLAVLSWAWRYSMSNPRALNKTSGVLIQRHAPSLWLFLFGVVCMYLTASKY